MNESSGPSAQEIPRETATEQTPLLPDGELFPVIEELLAQRDRLLAASAKHQGPLYLLDIDALEDRARRFREAFRLTLPDPGFYFAMKSNSCPELLRALTRIGFGIDVSSGREAATALDLGATNLVFSGPGKTDQEIRLALRHPDQVTILADSFGELARLEPIAAAEGMPVRIGVRLTTNPSGLWRKFGIPLDRLLDFFEATERTENVTLAGLQFHTSWNMTPAPQVAFITALGQTLERMPARFLERLEFLDIGGGYWPERGEWLRFAGTPEGHATKVSGTERGAPQPRYRVPAAPIDTFARSIGEAVERHLAPARPFRTCLEPGRWICNDGMHILINVVDKKADDLVITDGATNAVGWERFETDYFPVINLTRPDTEEHPCHVLGSLCTPHDVWGDAYFGAGIEVGDVLLVPHQGAYTYSLRQQFIKPLPNVVTLPRR